MFVPYTSIPTRLRIIMPMTGFETSCLNLTETRTWTASPLRHTVVGCQFEPSVSICMISARPSPLRSSVEKGGELLTPDSRSFRATCSR